MKKVAIVIGIIGLVFAAAEPMRWNLPVGVGMILAFWGLYSLAARKEKGNE